jgi:hypothetical protein
MGTFGGVPIFRIIARRPPAGTHLARTRLAPADSPHIGEIARPAQTKLALTVAELVSPMDVAQDQSQNVAAGEPIGTGWRVASWWAFGLALVIASQVMTTKSRDMVHAAVLAAAALFMLLVSGLGVVFALFGAAAAASAGDRRFVVLLPVLANAALLIGFLAAIFAP